MISWTNTRLTLDAGQPLRQKCPVMNGLFVAGGRALLGHEFVETSLAIADGQIVEIDAINRSGTPSLDAGDLLVLPGIVDIHGDAFERQMMPRPGVDFPLDVALVDTDRQVIGNGITTVFHATTWSWEPGLRSGDNARGLLEAIEGLRPRLAADTRFHLRHETYNLDAEDEIAAVADGTTHRPVRLQRSYGRDRRQPGASRTSASAWSTAPACRARRSIAWSSA